MTDPKHFPPIRTVCDAISPHLGAQANTGDTHIRCQEPADHDGMHRATSGDVEYAWEGTTLMVGVIERGDGDDQVDHPSHYNTGTIEVIDFIEDQRLGFHEGNVVKYVARAEHKGKQLQDLKKARWYLDRRIEQLEAGDD